MIHIKVNDLIKHIVSICCDGEEIKATNFVMGENYTYEGKKYELNDDFYNELVKYQEYSSKPFKVVRLGNSKVVNVTGKRVL